MRAANLFCIGVLACVIFNFVRTQLKLSNIMSLFVVAFFLSYPNHFVPVFETTAFDYLYQIFVVLCLWCYLAFSRSAGWGSYFGSIVFLLLALTSKEIAVAVLGGLGLIWLLWRPRKSVFFLIPHTVISVAFVIARKFAMKAEAGEYHAALDSHVALENLRNYIPQILRIGGPPVENVFHFEANERFLGILILLFLIYLWRSKVAISQKSVVLWSVGGIFAFLAIPCVAGGFPWHISLSLFFFSMIMGIFLKDCGAKPWTVIAIIFGLALYTKQEIVHFLLSGPRHELYELNRETLARPPLDRELAKGDVWVALIYKNDSYNHWVYQNLLRFIYKNPNFRQTPWNAMAAPEKLAWKQHPAHSCFAWDEKSKAWIDQTQDCEKHL